MLPVLAIAMSGMLAAGLPASAQMYKCEDGDKVAYSEAPCARGTQTVVPPPGAPAARREPAPLKQLQKQSAQLQKERLAREAQQDRADVLHDRRAAQHRDRCSKLELAHKWAEDDVRRASHRAIDAARLKARRAAERHAAACQ
nr:DUF4124 domain-containing protein [Pseudoduganella umbonata]